MANRFILNETSYHGAGAIQSIADEAKGRSFAKAFVCSDPDLIKFGVTKKVLDVLESADLAYEVYSNIKPNPTIENVQTGVEAFKKSGADYIIALILLMFVPWKVLQIPRTRQFLSSQFQQPQVQQQK